MACKPNDLPPPTLERQPIYLGSMMKRRDGSMNIEDEHPGSLRVAVEKLALGLVVLLVIYVLSIGPIYGVMVMNPEGKYNHFFDSLYAPVLWASRHAQFVNSAAAWYCDLWTPKIRVH